MGETGLIRTPDQRVRVFVSSTLQELAAERQAARDAVSCLRLVPVMFDLGARPHPPRQVYRAYLAQSQVFIGIYWQSYGWVAPGEEVSGLEDEYLLSAGMPRLIYVKSPAPEREPRLEEMITRIMDAGGLSFQLFSDPAELQRLVENDLAVLLSERFEMARPHNEVAAEEPLAGALPVPATPLVGRDQEAEAVADLVLREGVRLVTLTGPGGVGKSRLALEAGDRLGPSFEDGVRFVDLTSVAAAELVAAAIAAGLGLSTSGTRLISDVKSYLHPRRLLLVLDNFEQVTEAAPLVADFLSASPGVVALVTSRTMLRIRGEHEFSVPTLPVPQAGADLDAGELQQYAAVRLFVERAQAAAVGFALSGGNAGAVAQICRQLDGLPLAIELAAAKVRLLPPQALLARLDHRMTLLTGGARDLPERQRTLKNTLDWSFGLLSAGEQALFTRLGVFAGTFDLPAVEAVCGDAAPAGTQRSGYVMETLGSLVDSSLVRPEARSGEPRFGLLETIREYALERLREGDAWRDTHDKHAAYFLAFAEPDAAELQGPGQLAWLRRLEIEHHNVGAAVSWFIDQDQLGTAVHLVWSTWRYWWLHGHAEELARYKTLAKSERLPPHQRALALSGAGLMLTLSGEQARAQPLLEQSLPLYRQAGDKLGAALAAAGLGHLLALQHDYARASELLEQTLALLQETGTDELAGRERVQHLLDVALVNNFLGQIRLSQGDHDRAAQLFTDGLSASLRGPDRFTILISLYDLALSSQARGDLTGAAALLREGLSLTAEAGDEPSIAYYLEALAAVARLQGNPERAVTLVAAAGSLMQAKGSGWMHTYVPRAPHDDDVLAALRPDVGDAAFEQAWTQGRALESRRAVQYALQQG